MAAGDRAALWRAVAVVLPLAVLVLLGAALARSIEHDELYSIFVTGGTARPAWPDSLTTPGALMPPFQSHAGLAEIARLLRGTDVHPPLYFWALGLWRPWVENGLPELRGLSVLFTLCALLAWMVAAWRAGVPPLLAGLLTTLAYGFGYTGHIARGFALAHLFLALAVLAALAAWRWGRDQSWSGLGGPAPSGILPGEALPAAAGWRALGGGAAGQRGALPSGAFPAGAKPHGSPAGRASAALGWLAGRERRALIWAGLAGLAAGLASFTNYLAVFPAAAVLAWLVLAVPGWGRKLRFALAAGLPFLLLLVADMDYFLAQKASRTGQFEPFQWLPSLARLAQFNGANLLGGLPLYLEGAARQALGAGLVALLAAVGIGVLLVWRRLGPTAWLWLAGAAAPSLGLLGLGYAFDNTPVELRYVAFAAPFAAVLIAAAAGAGAGWAPRATAALLGLFLAVQAAGTLGMMAHPATQQPFRHAMAAVLPRLGTQGVLLLPFADDGVGVTGALLWEAPRNQPVLVLRNADAAAAPSRLAGHDRAVLMGFGHRDGAVQSRAASAAFQADPGWASRGRIWSDYRGSFAELFERVQPAPAVPLAAQPR